MSTARPSLLGRIALVTGASKGIGRVIARTLAAAGCDVAIAYGSDREGANAVLVEIEQLGGKALAIQCDVSEPKQVAALFDRTIECYSALDIVIANAGVELIDVPFVEYGESQYDRVFDINTKGTFFTLQNAAKSMRSGGRIIVVCSNTTVLSLPGFAVYGASKLAPKYFAEVLAKELGHRGVTVNSVSPGVTQSAGVFTSATNEDAYLRKVASFTPLQRVGTAQDVANAVLLLASPQASFITGQHLAVDGGAALANPF